jgi:hypothetical protein
MACGSEFEQLRQLLEEILDIDAEVVSTTCIKTNVTVDCLPPPHTGPGLLEWGAWCRLHMEPLSIFVNGLSTPSSVKLG